MNDEIVSIIQKRAYGAAIGMGIVVAVVIFLVSQNADAWLGFVIAGMLAEAPLCALYVVNKLNVPNPKPSYRHINTIIYIYLAKLVVIVSVIKLLYDLYRLLNPFAGGAASRGEFLVGKSADLLDASASAGTAYIAAKQLKPAELVERYFAEQTSAHV